MQYYAEVLKFYYSLHLEVICGAVEEPTSVLWCIMICKLCCLLDQVICAAWLRFEEEYGTLEDYDRAVLKVSFVLTGNLITNLMSRCAGFSRSSWYII